MNRVRVLIVDDSAVVRRMLTDILSAEPDLEVVGSAPNAAIARSRFETVKPDVVTLDVELPDGSGLDLLSEFRKKAPLLPIVMFSSLTQRAAATTLDALARGASDYVTKPSQVGSREEAIEHVRSHLVAKVRALTSRRRLPAAAPTSSVRPAARPNPAGGRIDLIAIGSSTGGPNALADVFKALPGNLPCPVVIVQHMPPVFTKLLADRLSATCPIQVREAAQGEVLVPGKAYIAPGDFHMRLAKDGEKHRIVLDQSAPENSCRPAVDVLFKSIPPLFGARALGVILTGMGQDGLIGVQQMRAAGAQIVVQDEATSVVWGMPGAVARAGAADVIVPVTEVGDEIVRRVLAGRAARPPLSREQGDVR